MEVVLGEDLLHNKIKQQKWYDNSYYTEANLNKDRWEGQLLVQVNILCQPAVVDSTRICF